ncbi:hypothetical protein LTR56_006763 [Elasticomyces elasticus]|nr:hypothetical protein LTR22_015477 [Elasticomyces elasticus]KAK3649580.1 hypothetical protein LTR56_006763 [Elasticomyces elasticus]KAK4915092.1 hypothetical protein LTR49_016720 [Elasticomyces elasticus]KAK5754548.1 hypothetical protein LTS12_015385 [Elasticomyces elasticus]
MSFPRITKEAAALIVQEIFDSGALFRCDDKGKDALLARVNNIKIMPADLLPALLEHLTTQLKQPMSKVEIKALSKIVTYLECSSTVDDRRRSLKAFGLAKTAESLNDFLLESFAAAVAAEKSIATSCNGEAVAADAAAFIEPGSPASTILTPSSGHTTPSDTPNAKSANAKDPFDVDFGRHVRQHFTPVESMNQDSTELNNKAAKPDPGVMGIAQVKETMAWLCSTNKIIGLEHHPEVPRRLSERRA